MYMDKHNQNKSFNSLAAVSTFSTICRGGGGGSFWGLWIGSWLFVCSGGVALMLIQQFVSLCHSSINSPSTFALISSYSWNVLSGMPMVASDTRQLTGWPKLLYLQRTASPWIIQEVPSTRVGDKGARKRLWLASSRSGKKTRAVKNPR